MRFVQDLHSGKLHREFHNGPDPTEAPTTAVSFFTFVSGVLNESLNKLLIFVYLGLFNLIVKN